MTLSAENRRPRRVGHRRERGQALVVGALMTFVLLGIAAFAVDVGMNYVDRRALQAASDQGALAAAGSLKIGTSTALSTGQAYAWANLHVTPTSTSCTSSPCTITYGNYPAAGSYQVTVTTPYTPTSATEYSNSLVVSVDVVHVNPRTGFEGVLGFSAVTVRSHSAALAHTGIAKFPFAIATRFLDITGNGNASAFGAVLIGDCNDNGVGDFTDHSVNGGLYLNGGGTLVLGRAADSTNTYYTSAQAALLADGRNHKCGSNDNNNPDTTWSTLNDSRVNFTDAYNEFNYDYGFTSGPIGCGTSAADATTCTTNPIGDGNWQDPPCWKQSNGTIVPIASTTVTYTSGGSIPTGVGSGTACKTSVTNSYEGSFVYSNFPTFPTYSDPISVLSGLGVSVANTGSATLTSGTIAPNQYFTSYTGGTGASLLFTPGYYVFSGTAASVALKTGGSFSCKSPSLVSPAPTVKGCVFIFSNGASLDIQSSSAAVNCNGDSGSTYGNCAFEFTDSNSTSSYLSLTNGVSVAAHPIAYTSGTQTLHFPLVYSNSANNCLSKANTNCSVAFSQPGTFDVAGTIYAPHGIVDISANGSSASGQVVSDSVRLQSGNSGAATGVAYRGDEVAPVLGPATLIE